MTFEKPKSEIRAPKEIRTPESELPCERITLRARLAAASLGLRISNFFRLSDFALRISLRRSLIAFAAMAIAFAFAGCQTSPEYAAGLPLPLTPGTANYATNVLEEGDVVSITFLYSTNLNAVQKISLDGTLNLEMAGQVKAAGETPLQLQDTLARLYKPQIKDDVVTVKLIAASASIYISGAVFRPGKVAIERPMTVLEAIMEAGGFDPNRAQLSNVGVLRIVNGKQRRYRINLKRILDGNDATPFYLQPFDIVHVPTKTFNL